MTEKKKLSEDSTINEMFEFYDISAGGCRVAPLTIQEDPKDTRICMVVRGDLETASIIFAAMYNAVQELSDVAAQREAAQDDEPRIFTG